MSVTILTANEQSRTARDNELVMSHLDSVRQILNRVLFELPPNVDHENLKSAGMLGLVEAAAKYDPTLGVTFKSFAYCRIRGAIIDELRRNCPLPQRVLENLRAVRDTTRHATRTLAIEVVAEQTGLSAIELSECRAAARLTAPTEFNEQHEDVARTVRSNDRPEQACEVQEVRQKLATALEKLPTRERQTITLYYFHGRRLKEIGVMLGISESRTSRLLSRASEILRNTLHSLGIVGPFDLPA